MRHLDVGTRVCYSRAFLQSIAQYAGRAPFARGSIIGFSELIGGLTLASVEWDDGVVSSVNVRNLWPVSRLHLEPV
jgi:hypothetical protein